jgi:callose synthase
MSTVNLSCSYTLYPVKEIYRIKLPGPAKIGEGKPENQNHAIIFTRGEALQTIDMNQVN